MLTSAFLPRRQLKLMRAIALLFFLVVLSKSVVLLGNEWYVAPEGSDSADGKRESPFATLTRAQQNVAPGDTVFIRGGIYRIKPDQVTRRRGLFARIFVLDKSGAADAPITYSAFEDEKPIFDCTEFLPRNQRVTVFYVSGDWLHLKGIEVTGVQVTIKTHTQSICFESQGNNNRFEQLLMHDSQAIGIYHVNGSNNLFLNCDAWNNWDYTSDQGHGGNVDGFGCHPSKGSVGNVFRGCRAWFNSDDGYDCITAQESVAFENCWAMYNGLAVDGKKLADGNGFKAGGYGSATVHELPKKIPRHVVQKCIAVGNKNSGFYANHHPGGGDWLNNTAFRNGTNFNMLCRLADNKTDVDGYDHVLKNNLSFESRYDVTHIDRLKCELNANSFDLERRFRKADFVSLDEDELIAPRQQDGSLPRLNLMKPMQGSGLIDTGVDVGLSFIGKLPDIGAIEIE